MKFDPERRRRLTSAERRKRLPPERILTDIGLKPGQTLVDIGAGTGFFSIPAAAIVGPSGCVYSLDISRDMLTDLKTAARRQKAKNIRPILAGETEPNLPAGADFYFLANVFHELEDREKYLRRISERASSSSRVVVIDYYKKPSQHGPPFRERIPLKAAKALFEKLGFRIERSFRVNDEEYGIIAAPPRA